MKKLMLPIAFIILLLGATFVFAAGLDQFPAVTEVKQVNACGHDLSPSDNLQFYSEVNSP